MDNNFNPEAIEQSLYAHWEKADFFKASDSGNGYCILIPPPNVTGTLHMGHAFNQTLMDTLIRYQRMQGAGALPRRPGRLFLCLPQAAQLRQVFRQHQVARLVRPAQTCLDLGEACHVSAQQCAEEAVCASGSFTQVFSFSLLLRGRRPAATREHRLYSAEYSRIQNWRPPSIFQRSF